MSNIFTKSISAVRTLASVVALSFALQACAPPAAQNDCNSNADCGPKQICLYEDLSGTNGHCESQVGGACDDDPDCLADLVCEQSTNTCDYNGFEHEIAKTNAQGQVEFTQLSASIKDEQGNPVANLETHLAVKGDKYILVVRDVNNGSIFPEMVMGSLGASAQKADSPYETKAFPLNSFLDIIVEEVQNISNLFNVFSGKKQFGTYLSETNETREVCMSADQMIEAYVKVPAGVLEIAFSASGANSSFIQIAKDTPFNEIYQTIKDKMGASKGYIVSIPKTAIDLCENNTQSVCELSNGELQNKVFGKNALPVWGIVGYCEPAGSETPNCVSTGIQEKYCQDSSTVAEKDNCGDITGTLACGTGYECKEQGSNAYCAEVEASCEDTCSPAGKTNCYNGMVGTCGDYDADSCLEWQNVECQTGYECKTVNGTAQCVEEEQNNNCQDECDTLGEMMCLNWAEFEVCGNYDNDPCLEWGGLNACDISYQECVGNQCVDD